MGSSPQIENAILTAVRQALDDGDPSNTKRAARLPRDPESIRSIRLWRGVAAVVLAAGSIAAWYRGFVSEEIRADIAAETNAAARIQFVDEQISEVNTRVDGVSSDLDAFTKEQRQENAAIRSQTGRTEQMVEDLARKRGVKIPPKR